MRCSCTRRDFIARGMYGLGLGAGLPFILNRTSAALAAQALEGTSIEKHPNRILVVIELSGGNDGLNTVVPFGDAAYYKARPKLGIPEREAIKVADGFGFHPSMVGFERLALFLDGLLASRRPKRRRVARMAGPRRRRDAGPEAAQPDRQPGDVAVPRRAEPPAFTAGFRRSRTLQARRHRRRERDAR